MDSARAGDSPGAVSYSLTLSAEEAAAGVVRVLTRHDKRLEVKVPAGARTGQIVRLRNALNVTDAREGDILIRLTVQTGAGSGEVEVVTDATFESEVLHSGAPVVVDFWAPWCGPCKALAPVTERLAAEYTGKIKFCKVNVDENPLASRRYQVASIPTVLLFKGGSVADVSVGAVSADDLRARIDRILAGP
jgi:thioredoxin 1